MNRVILMGRLCADPDSRTTTDGTSVCHIRIAVQRPYRTKDGGREADFINVTCWRSTADLVARYFTKGRMILVEGSLRVSSYTAQNGENRTRTEVVADNVYFCDSKSSQGGYQSAPQESYQPPSQQGYQPAPQQSYQPAPQQSYQQPAPPQSYQQPAPQRPEVDLDDFEEVISDGDLPF